MGFNLLQLFRRLGREEKGECTEVWNFWPLQEIISLYLPRLEPHSLKSSNFPFKHGHRKENKTKTTTKTNMLFPYCLFLVSKYQSIITLAIYIKQRLHQENFMELLCCPDLSSFCVSSIN